MTSETVNGTTTSYTYNTVDEQQHSGSYPYNGAGDQTTTAAGTTLAYNNLSQTDSVTVSGGSAHTYSYTGSGQAGLLATGATSLQNSSILGVTATTTSSTTSRYTRTPTGALTTLRTGGSSYYYLTDARGNIIGLINSSGTVAGTYSYDPYGNITNTVATGAPTTNPFRYAASYLSADGLYHDGARFYDPTTGRWTQLDPTGQNPGYNYAGSDPINNTDPSGADDVSSALDYGSAAASDAAFGADVTGIGAAASPFLGATSAALSATNAGYTCINQGFSDECGAAIGSAIFDAATLGYGSEIGDFSETGGKVVEGVTSAFDSVLSVASSIF